MAPNKKIIDAAKEVALITGASSGIGAAKKVALITGASSGIGAAKRLR